MQPRRREDVFLRVFVVPVEDERWGQRAATGVSFFLSVFLASAAFLRLSDVCAPYFLVNRSTRPSVSMSFCLPVKNGWQLEQISTRRVSPLIVERVGNVCPQAQCTVTA